MSLHTLSTHLPRHATAEILKEAVEVVTRSGVVDLLASTAQAAGAQEARGRKPTLGQYTPIGLLCTMYEVTASGHPTGMKSMVDAIWDRYTDEHLHIIGLGHVRTETRRALVASTVRGYSAEYMRMYSAHERFFAGMDDTPKLDGFRGTGRRPTRAQVAVAAADPDLTLKTQLKLEVLNRIVAASIEVADESRLRKDARRESVFANWHGHIAIDETHLGTGLGDLPKEVAPGNYLARKHGHSRQHKGNYPAVIGLTIGVAIADPRQRLDVPPLVTALSIHHPTGGRGQAVLDIVDAMYDTGVLAARTGNAKQYIVVDQGYSEANNLNVELVPRRYGLVKKHRDKRNKYFEVGAIHHPDGETTPGVKFNQGMCHCPGESAHVLERLHLEPPQPDPTDPQNARKHAEHALLEARLNATRMPTNGRPAIRENRTRGGQRKGAAAVEKVVRVSVTCPHVAGRARCPIFENFHDPDVAHLPIIPNAPIDLPLDRRPACCANESGIMRLNITLTNFKLWQDFPPGTWAHEDWYTGPRSTNERINSLLKRKHGGTDLERGAIAPRRASTYGLFVAFAIAVTNRRIIETWDRNTKHRTPAPPGYERARQRERILRNLSRKVA